MRQVFLVRHGETQWNAERRIQGQSDSLLTAKGEFQDRQTALRLKNYGITHIISSDLGRALQTATPITEQCHCPVISDLRFRELNMGVLESRRMESLSPEEEAARQSLLNGDPCGRIENGESMAELAERMQQGLAACLDLPAGSRVAVISHGVALGCLISTLLGLPAWAERRLRLRNGSVSRVNYQQSAWLAKGWIVESTGDISHLSASALDE